MTAPSPAIPAPDRDCRLCPRLAAFLDEARQKNPGWHNAPVNGFGPLDARLVIIGLAPGMRGANRTGRPFTGDFAGDLLYATLDRFGLSQGIYQSRPDDGVQLINTRIVNAVRCVPPQNKPTAAEINTCRDYLRQELDQLKQARVYLTLGRVGHFSTLRCLGLKPAEAAFGHGACHRLADGRWIISSYHCSRYNTQTGRLTAEGFASVFRTALDLLGK